MYNGGKAKIDDMINNLFSLLWNFVGSHRAVVLPKMRVTREGRKSGKLCHNYIPFPFFSPSSLIPLSSAISILSEKMLDPFIIVH